MNDIEDIYELSPIQQGMLFHSALAPDSGAYIVQMLWTLDADLDVRAFRQAWDGVVRRHTALRTAFHWQGLEKPLQVVHRSASVEWTVREAPAVGESDDERLQAFLDADRRAGFDPGRAPLMRAALFRYADGSFRFVLTNHHLLMDGWSLPLVLHEVFLGYEAAMRGNPPPPLPHPRPFRDYILWLQAHPVEEAETFWRGALAGLRSATPLPFAAPAGAAPATPDAEEGIRLSAEVCAGLERVARRAGVTPNTVMQGAWALLLEACTGEADVLFGATSSGVRRSWKGWSGWWGCSSTPSPCACRWTRGGGCTGGCRRCRSGRPVPAPTSTRRSPPCTGGARCRARSRSSRRCWCSRATR
jgi:hypothetical protein